mmetsp:Transcript_124535/g.248428  ORF Transcript_124535/g.248428 Transcript_124535/m.248428 type:complete len:97 (+) Transcript_124535:2305-2595(+)
MISLWTCNASPGYHGESNARSDVGKVMCCICWVPELTGLMMVGAVTDLQHKLLTFRARQGSNEKVFIWARVATTARLARKTFVVPVRLAAGVWALL